MASVIESTSTAADGHGRWCAHVKFARTLSESDTREEFNLGRHWPTIRRHARDSIVTQITQREQKTTETHCAAERRVRSSLGNLVVISQDLDHMNIWHGVTLGES